MLTSREWMNKNMESEFKREFYLFIWRVLAPLNVGRRLMYQKCIYNDLKIGKRKNYIICIWYIVITNEIK